MGQELTDIVAVLEALIAGDIDHARQCLANLREHAADAERRTAREHDKEQDKRKS